MIVIAAAPVDARSASTGERETDLGRAAFTALDADLTRGLLLPIDTVDDEVRLPVDRGGVAIAIACALSRGGRWSVGLGVGTAASAPVAAHVARTQARKRHTGFAIEPRTVAAVDAEALVDLLLVLRARRTTQGWEMYDLVTAGLTQAQAAESLGITPQSASKRARAADLRAEDAAVPALARLLDGLDAAV
jgi:hypothetical protein